MADKPNIIVITSHDTGRHLGCYGVSEVNTPNIDALAASGVKFNRHFATVPICSASRASMMTGQYPQTNGLLDLTGFGWAIDKPEHHLSNALRDKGYRTCLFGLQHETKQYAELGYEKVDPDLAQHRNSFEIVKGLGQFLKSDAASEKPFFASVAFFETHTPFGFGGAEPDDSNGVFVPPYLQPNETAKRTCAALQGAVRQLDGLVGGVMKALRESGLEENTILIYTTDHGVELPRAKWFCYDAGIEIAMIMRWPGGGVAGGREVNSLTSNVDNAPTLYELAGLKAPEYMQGVSFASLATDRDDTPTRDAVYSLYHKNMSRSIRSDRHKLIRYFDTATDFHTVPVRIEDVLAKRVIKQVELFDLENDPTELNNLADDPAYAEIRRDLDTKLWSWLERVDEPLLKGPIATPLYQKAMGDYHTWKSAE